MRTLRALAIAGALLSLAPTAGWTQSSKPFVDSWFWGLKTGGFWYTGYSGDRQAPVVGADWLITRTHGGLYASYSQTFLSDKNFVVLNSEPSDTLPREIDLKNMRRLELAGMVFPGDSRTIHPYVGLGVVLKQVNSATPQGSYADQTQYTATQAYVQSYRTGFSPLFLVGSQFNLRTVAVFGQFSLTPAQETQFLYNNRPFQAGYEIGVRYNIGSSIAPE